MATHDGFKFRFLTSCLVAVWGAASLVQAEQDPAALSGGGATHFVSNQHAFAKSSPSIPVEKIRDFAFGNSLFNTNWVIAPGSVGSLDGLGPLFNRVSCSACHVRDGRGRPPEQPDEPMTSMLIRLSVPGKAADGGPMPEPVYGGQLQDRAIPGVRPEGRVRITYTEIPGQFADGETYSLRKPSYEFYDLGYRSMREDVLYSPRVAPAVFGLGLLEAVDEAVILQQVERNAANPDGVRGQANIVWNAALGKKVVGRFGWKANAPTLRQQAAGAANGDIGITSSMFRKDHVTLAQAAAVQAPSGGDPELSDEQLDRMEYYLRTLGVPAKRNLHDSQVQQGEKLFAAVGCAACHVPTLTTGTHKLAELSKQVIHPYTDLLVHDMGEALADHRPDYEASGTQWRTPPLWGIGLIKVVNGHTYLLHDGRARNLMEAILWHEGEARVSRDRVLKLSKAEREALLAFLESL